MADTVTVDRQVLKSLLYVAQCSTSISKKTMETFKALDKEFGFDKELEEQIREGKEKHEEWKKRMAASQKIHEERERERERELVKERKERKEEKKAQKEKEKEKKIIQEEEEKIKREAVARKDKERFDDLMRSESVARKARLSTPMSAITVGGTTVVMPREQFAGLNLPGRELFGPLTQAETQQGIAICNKILTVIPNDEDVIRLRNTLMTSKANYGPTVLKKQLRSYLERANEEEKIKKVMRSESEATLPASSVFGTAVIVSRNGQTVTIEPAEEQKETVIIGNLTAKGAFSLFGKATVYQ